MKISLNTTCPCGSLKEYKKCCKIFHIGALPKTALLLMKSRYSAFCVNDYKYIIKTTHFLNVDYTNDIAFWKESILEFCTSTEFNSLEILDTKEDEKISYVTFRVNLKQNNEDITFCEKSRFEKINDSWLYHSGEFL